MKAAFQGMRGWRPAVAGMRFGGALDAVGPAVATAGFMLAIGVACVAASFAAVTNSPVVIGLFAGLVLGGFLLWVPRLALWLCVIGSLLVSGVVSLFLPALSKITWLFSMLGFFLTLASAFSLLAHTELRRSTPGYIWLGLGLMMFAIGFAPIAGSSLPEVMAGAKRCFQLWGVMFACAGLMRDTKDLGRIVRLLAVLAALQLPFALYQRFVLVPRREGMGNGVVPIDVVSGTFEASFLGGGNSSGMVLFLTMALALVIAAWREGALKGLPCLLLAVLFALPMGLGETKVVVLFLPLMLLVLFGRYFKRAPVASVLMLAAGIGCTVLLFYIYAAHFGRTGLSVADRLRETIAYNFGSVGYLGSYSLNRTTALTHWWAHHGFANPHELLFGHGLGSSYFAPASFVQGHVARAHGYIGIGLTAASSILWDLGLVGLLVVLAIMALAWRRAGRALHRAPDGWSRAAMVAARVGLLLFGVLLFYADSLLNALSVQCLWMLTLGGIAVASRCWSPDAAPAAFADTQPMLPGRGLAMHRPRGPSLTPAGWN
jgi:hypothetical protein